MNLFNFILDRVWFRCLHRNLSRVFTLPDEAGNMRTYQKCLTCGFTVHYDLGNMKPISERKWRQVQELETLFKLEQEGKTNATSRSNHSR
jgi:hypothetical protein